MADDRLTGDGFCIGAAIERVTGTLNQLEIDVQNQARRELVPADWVEVLLGDLRLLLAAATQQERDAADAESALAAYHAALNLCPSHTPFRWEGDGTCVICEATANYAALAASQAEVARLKEAFAESAQRRHVYQCDLDTQFDDPTASHDTDACRDAARALHPTAEPGKE